MTERVRFAIVGLGHIGRNAILSAFENTPSAQLVTAFSSDPVKRVDICKSHHLAKAYPYEEFERGLGEQRVDAVFIALPNNLHRVFAERAANARVNVLCEKPLANTAEDCSAMKHACDRNRVLLMPGYRHHFSDAYRTAIGLANGGELGELRSVHSLFTVSVKPNNIRVSRSAGGGTLPDIGIYCINTMRNLLDSEPVKLSGSTLTRPDDSRFTEVEEMFTAVMAFPGARLATFTCEFGASRAMTLDLVGTKGTAHFDAFYDYRNDGRMELNIDGRERVTRTFPKTDQFAAEIEAFAQAIRAGGPTPISADEAISDARVMEALYSSAGE